MMTGEPTTGHWREAHGGFRATYLLFGGAALLAVGALTSLAVLGMSGLGMAVSAAGTRSMIVFTGWIAYILGLGLVGTGFFWTCVAGLLPRVGLAAAVLHLLQGSYLLFILFGSSEPPISPVTLAAGRLLAVFILAGMATAELGKWPARALGAAAGLGLIKTLARVIAPQADGGAALDAMLLLMMALAIWLTARRLRCTEDDWAQDQRPGGKTDFSEFNNPEHDWNKTGTPPAPPCAGSTP